MKTSLLRRIEWHRPQMILAGFILFSILLWTLQCSLLQNILGLDILETVTWGALGAWGHAKHPPLSGWLGYLFSLISGHADWGLYLLAQLCLATGVWFTAKTLRLFFDELPAVTSALLLYFLYYYTPSWMKFSTYFVEMALTPLAAWCFFSALKTRHVRYWCGFGIVCGLGILNKYSFGLQMIGFMLVFFSFKEYRKQLAGTGPYLAGLFFTAVILPHIVWLVHHHFICFGHVSSRMSAEHDHFMALEVLGTLCYPFAMVAAALFLSWLPDRKTFDRHPLRRDVLRWTLILTLTPAFFYVLLALFGSDIIMMWLCSTFSWTGAAVVAAMPFVITPSIFRRLTRYLMLFIFLMFLGTSTDLIFCARKRIHTRPEAITVPALNFWKEFRNDPVPVVSGDRWYSCVFENYTPERPPACEAGDPVFWERHGRTIEEKGCLFLGDDEDLKLFISQTGYPPRAVRKINYCGKSLSGDECQGEFHAAYFPPKREALHRK